jgi:hypothetical protein
VHGKNNCSDNLEEEVADVRAYMNLLVEVWKNPPAARLLLGLHNVISKSIDLKYRPEGRRRIYCWANYRAELGQIAALEIPAPAEGFLEYRWKHVADLAAKVPGLGNDNCQENH